MSNPAEHTRNQQERDTATRVVSLLAGEPKPPDAASREDARWEVTAAAEADGHGPRAQARVWREVTRLLGW